MAKTRCPARYKNLGLETFGEKKKVTDEILKQFCKNDEWLRQQVEELRYLSPPAVRKSMRSGENLDIDKSWGCMVNNQNKIQFNTLTQDRITIDLTTDEGLNKWFDKESSTAISKEITLQDGSKYKRICIEPHIETQTGEVVNFGTAEMYNGYNSAWYVGFDKSKPFYLKPKWIKDPKQSIPAIARAQTFYVATGCGGKLEHIDIELEYNGVPTMSSSDLYVQLWDTYQGWVNKSKWDNSTKKTVREYITITKHKQLNNNEAPPSSWQRYERKTVYEKNKKGEIIKDKKGKKKYHYEYKKLKKTGLSEDKIYVVKREKVAKPYSKGGQSLKKPIAEKIHNPNGTTKNGMQSITFDTPVILKENHSYAIVLFSPLSNWENCPRWCGWGRNCRREKTVHVGEENGTVRIKGAPKDASFYDGGVYTKGDAFYSSDNGKTWHRYGKNGSDEEISVYRQGKYTPQDFRFRCRVKHTPDVDVVTYSTETKILNLKPIYHNPIYKVTLNPIDKGSEQAEQANGLYITYQLSTDGDNWENFSNDLTYELENPSRVIFIRALLQSDKGTIPQDANLDDYTPYIEQLHINLDMHLPTEMYARTQPYTPEKFGTILGASVWGRVFAPYKLENDNVVDCKVDIIQTKVDKDHFSIIDLELLDEKITELALPNMQWVFDDNKQDVDSRCTYLTQHPNLIEYLKEFNVYILPHEMDDGMHNLSFAPLNDDGGRDYVVEPLPDELGDVVVEEQNGVEVETDEVVVKYPDNIGGIPLTKEVAYPIISCQIEPEGSDTGRVSAYGEWYDYVFDYKTNELIFKRDTLNRMPTGSLDISFNPVFIKDLTNEEIGIHYDEDGNRTDGLVLDYFKETIEITDDELDNNRVRLKVDAVDPIRQVYLYNSDEDEPIPLIEDYNYYYDINTHEIVFDADSGISLANLCELNDVLEIVYTPNLDDTSICIGYNATRTDTSKQCYIEDYYIEYKV